MPYKDRKKALKYRVECRKRNKAWIKDYLSKHPCEECGFSDIRALEFDHKDPKAKRDKISQLANGTTSIKALELEISTRCRVLCANCHRIKTVSNLDYLNSKNCRGEEQPGRS